MVCPNCGLSLTGTNAQMCPRCGQPLQAPGHHPDYYAPPPAQPGMPPNEPFYGQAAQPSYPMYGPPGMPPTFPPGYPPSGPYDASGPYGQGAPITTPFYGQAAPPSYPMYGAPMPGAYPSPAWPGAQPQPQRRRGNGLVIGLSIGIVVLILIASVAAVAVMQNARTSIAAISTATSVPTTTSAHRVLFQDPLTSNRNGWSEDDHCSFASDGYHIKNGWICFAPAGILSDFDLTVHVKQLSGPLTYGYGVVFRRTGTGNEYAFFIDSNSKWSLYKCVNSSCSKLVDWTSDGSLPYGLNVSHTVEVKAQGPHITCYADGAQLGSVDDSTFLSGRNGLEAGSNIEAVFSNLTITSV